MKAENKTPFPTDSDTNSKSQPIRVRLKTPILITSLIMYLVSFMLLALYVKRAEAIPSVFPVITVAWLFGLLPGIVAAVVSFPVNIIMCIIAGVGWQTMVYQGGIQGTVALVIIAAVVGRMQDLATSAQRELSERKRAEEILRKSEERFRRMAENIRDGLTIFEDHTISYVNDRMCEITGYARDEFLTMKGLDFVLPEDRERLRTFYEEFRRSGTVPEELEFRILRKDGSVCHIQNRYSVNRVDDKALGFYIITADITERKRFEEERETLIKELQAALAQVKTLGGLLPICSSCKKIRDDRGYWNQIEEYIQQHSYADFSHGICPECAEKLYPDIFKNKDEKSD